MTEIILAYLIIILGTINAIRMSFLFISGDVYDCFWARNKRKFVKKNYRPLISIIIAAYNEEKVIKRTLDSIYASKYRNFEVVIVDDGSKDRTGRIVKRFKNNKLRNLTLVSQENGGKAIALNNALKNYVKGNLIMTLDADSVLANDALKKVIVYFCNPKVVAVASNVKIIKQNSLLGIIQYIEYLLGYRLKKAYTVLNNEYIIGGIGSTFRKSAIKHVNYYDTDTVTEDIDLTMKIIAKGNKNNKVIYASDVICYTEPAMNVSDLFKQRYRWKFGRFQTLYKNVGLFFNRSKIYSKPLTFLQLPFVIYSELAFLIDPILVTFIIYLCIKYRETASLLGVFSFLAFYVILAIVSDEHLSHKERIYFIIFAPLSYFFFFIISLVEYAALVKSIIRYKGIIYAREIGKCGWEHVDRIGSSLSV